MSRTIEQTFCLDSFNRDTTVYIEPNEFILDLKGRYEVQFATLAGLELPLSQYTIEDEWNTFEFDVGFSIFDAPCRTATVVVAPGQPSQTNIVIPAPAVQLIGLGGNLWETADGTAHGLFQATLNVANFSASVLLPSAIEAPTPVTAVPTLNQVVGAPNAAGDYGALVVGSAGARSFTGPHQFAAVLNAAFSTLGWPASFSYDGYTNRATLTAPVGFELRDNPDAVLPRSLGFVCRPGYGITHFPAFSDNFPAGQRIAGAIPVGNYEASNFRSTLESIINPLSTAGVVASAAVFYIEVYGGAGPVGIAVPALRSYHPQGIAVAITSLIAAAGLPTITLNFVNDRYRFDTTGAAPFVVTWGATAADQDLSSRLGFDPTPTPLDFQAIGAPRFYVDLPTAVGMPLVFEGESINTKRRFVFSSRPRVQRTPLVPIVVTSDGVNLTVPVGSVPLEYLILVDGSFFAVAQYVQGDVVVLTPLGTVPPAGPYTGLIVPVLTAAFNVYMIPQSKACFNRLAEIIGLLEGQSGWSGTATSTPGALIAPNIWTFEGPPYVLLDLGLQHMSALMSHRCKEDLKTHMQALLQLYPTFKIDRGIPMSKKGTGVSVVSQLKITLLNPWHTPYRFHGRNWSLTVVMGVAQRPVGTECP